MTDHKDLIELAYAQADNLEAYFREYHTVPILEISVHTIRHLADAIEDAQAERDAAWAEATAAAYLAAANVIDAKEEASSTKTNKRFLLDRSFGNLTATAYAPAILALTPADATAALEAHDELVRAEERAKVVEELRESTKFCDICKMEANALHTEASRGVK